MYTKKEQRILNQVRRLQAKLDALAWDVAQIAGKSLERQGYVEHCRHPSRYGDVVYYHRPRFA